MSLLNLLSVGGVMLAAATTSAARANFASRHAKAAISPSQPPSAKNGYYSRYAGVDGQKRSVVTIPGSVTVMSRDVLDDLNARTLGDALRSEPGVANICR
jgi:outer membrane receptor for monomeric catechols